MNYSSDILRRNLLFLMDECKISLVELSKNTGVPVTTIQRIRTDKDANPTIASLMPIATFFNLSVDQLIEDESAPQNRIKGSFKENKSTWQSVPIIQWEDISAWLQQNRNKQLPYIQTDIEVSEQSFALRMEENASDGFTKNAIIIIDPNNNFEPLDYALVRKAGSNHASIKQVLINDNEIYLRPLNEHFKTVILDDSFSVLGIVKQIRKDFINK